MSIYASVNSGDDPIVYSTDYEPRPLTDADEPSGAGFIDVATAHPFHNKVRLIVKPSNVCLDEAGARELAARLIIAADVAAALDDDGVDR